MTKSAAACAHTHTHTCAHASALVAVSVAANSNYKPRDRCFQTPEYSPACAMVAQMAKKTQARAQRSIMLSVRVACAGLLPSVILYAPDNYSAAKAC